MVDYVVVFCGFNGGLSGGFCGFNGGLSGGCVVDDEEEKNAKTKKNVVLCVAVLFFSQKTSFFPLPFSLQNSLYL